MAAVVILKVMMMMMMMMMLVMTMMTMTMINRKFSNKTQRGADTDVDIKTDRRQIRDR